MSVEEMGHAKAENPKDVIISIGNSVDGQSIGFQLFDCFLGLDREEFLLSKIYEILQP